MGVTEWERKLDKLAGVQEQAILDRTASDNQLRVFLKQTSDAAANLANWGANQRELYERWVHSMLVKKLTEDGFVDFDIVPEAYCKLPFHRVEEQDINAVEWDDVFTCSDGAEEYLFLVEAKKTARQRGMLNMPDRIQRTLHFIQACKDGAIKPTSRRHRNRIFVWSNFDGLKVRGVLAADHIPPEATQMAQREKYVTLQLSSSSYDYKDWSK